MLWVRLVKSSQAASSNLLPNRGESFDSILLKAVDIALSGTLGASGAVAVKFYVDTSALLKNPEAFQESLRKLFKGSEYGPNLLEQKIKESLIGLLSQLELSIIRNDELEKKTLRQFIMNCKSLFLSKYTLA